MKIKINGFAILAFTASVLTACESSLEQDAQKMADYQCKGAENLLAGKLSGNRQPVELDPEASKFYEEVMLKYSSEAQYEEFDKAISEALENCDFFAQRKEPKNKISRREKAKIASLSPEA